MIDYAEVSVSVVNVGTRLKADGDFTCIDEGSILTVMADLNGELYVPCKEGRHYLAGQLNDSETYYVGFWLVAD